MKVPTPTPSCGKDRGVSSCAMNKPVVFFSHSSKDKAVLAKLKELFVEKAGATIEVFLSSDGQSIPLGRNWVHRVEEGLKTAKVMLVFLTPSSLESSWIFFEAGYERHQSSREERGSFLRTPFTVSEFRREIQKPM